MGKNTNWIYITGKALLFLFRFYFWNHNLILSRIYLWRPGFHGWHKTKLGVLVYEVLVESREQYELPQASQLTGWAYARLEHIIHWNICQLNHKLDFYPVSVTYSCRQNSCLTLPITFLPKKINSHVFRQRIEYFEKDERWTDEDQTFYKV